jgi:hypothetical protein
MMTVKAGFENMTWYGPRGETYVDRKTGYPVGINKCTVTDNFGNYVRAQETGMKVDVRWFALTDDDGFGMIFKGNGRIPTPPGSTTLANTSLIQFNALHYRPDDLHPAPGNNQASVTVHPYQLTKRDDITLRVAITSTGVGGDNSWGAFPMTDYRVNVNGKTYTYNYTITPVDDLYATDTFGASELQGYTYEIANNAEKIYPAKAAELVADAKKLSAPDNIPAIPDLKDIYKQLVDAFNLNAYIAVYDDVGRLIGVSMVDAKILTTNGEMADFIKASGITAGPNDMVKIFLWDDALIPFTDAFVVGWIIM